MSRDPEVESIANEALLRAAETFDPTQGLTMEQWATFVIRTRVWTWWRAEAHRRKHVEFAAHAEPACEDEAPTEHEVDPNDWALLVAVYVDRQAMWSLAREHGTTEYKMRARVAAARDRFIATMEG